MGCHCTKGFFDSDEEEEFLMRECETALGFPSHSSHALCTQVLVLTVNQQLNWNRLKRMSQGLALPLPDISANEDPVAGFYRSISLEGCWQSKQLGMLALLLGKGSFTAKAELLFTFYDQEYNKFLASEEVVAVVTDLCEMALIALPIYCVAHLEHNNNLDAAVLIQNYAAKLQEVRATTIERVKALVLGTGEEQISLLTFKERANDLAFLFSSRLLRRHAIAQYKEMMRDQAKHKSKNTKGPSK